MTIKFFLLAAPAFKDEEFFVAEICIMPHKKSIRALGADGFFMFVKGLAI